MAVALAIAVGVADGAAAGDRAAVGLGLGLVDVADLGSTLWLTGHARIPAGKRLCIAPEVGYWSKSDSFFGIDVSIKDVSLGANALYAFPGRSSRSASGPAPGCTS